MMLDLLPVELCVDIFLRLPIKTLVACACTCKPLLNFLTSPDFMSTHIKKSKENPFIYFRCYKYVDDKEGGPSKEYFALQPDNESFDGTFDVKEMPFKDCANRYLTVVGNCNGVICLSDDALTYTNTMYLWNPSIRKAIRLPCPKIPYVSNGEDSSCVGFGFDEVTGDYKVVRLVYLAKKFPGSVQYPLIELYTVSSKSWRMLTVPGLQYCIRNSCLEPYSQCYLNGVVHWPGYEGTTSVWSAIVTFDVHNESFGEMKMPVCFQGMPVRDYYLEVTMCRGKLALIRMPRAGTSAMISGSIWVMEEYGNLDKWTVVFNFGALTKCPAPEALYLRKNMDLLIMSTPREFRMTRYLYAGVFSVGDGTTKAELLEIMEGPPTGFYLGSYEESLALFNKAIATNTVEVDSDGSTHPFKPFPLTHLLDKRVLKGWWQQGLIR